MKKNLSIYLSNKEKQISKLYFIKNSSLDIGLHLGISQKTVEHHLRNIRGKMQESNSLSAILKAHYTGLLEFSD